MTSQKHLKNLFAIAALGAGLSIASSAIAAPRDRDVKEARKEVREERKDLKKAKKEARKADTREERREAREDVREERRDVKKAKKEVKQERRENRRGDSHWDNRRNDNRRYEYKERSNSNSNRYNDRDNNYDRNNSNNGYRTFTGTVRDINSNGQLKVRIGSKTYDVFTNDRLPRGLDEGDVVRIYGVRSGSDDIRNANVSIVDNN